MKLLGQSEKRYFQHLKSVWLQIGLAFRGFYLLAVLSDKEVFMSNMRTLIEAGCGFGMIDLRDIKDAMETIRDLVERPPLAYSRFLSDFCRGEVYLKLENLQITNSFKIRGALNKMLHLRAEETRQGVVTASAGNHALAVAIGAEKLTYL